jgi:hypothetical protein
LSQVRRDLHSVPRGAEGLAPAAGHASGESAARVEPSTSWLLGAELDPDNEDGPEELGRFLAEARQLPAETRAGLASLIRKEHGRPLASLVETSFPLGSDRRRRLAATLVGREAGLSSGVTAMADDAVSETLASLGATLPAAPPPVVPAAASLPEHARDAVTAQAPQAVAWAERAGAILGPRLRATAEALTRLERKVALGRALLATVAPRRLPARHVVARASALLEEAQFAAGVTRELAPTDPDLPSALLRAVLARSELVRVRSALVLLNEVLGRLARRTAAVRPTPGEIGDIDRAALEVREGLYGVQAAAELLLDLEGGGGAGSPTEGDVRALGLAFERNAPPPQTFWAESAVRALVEQGRERSEPRFPVGAGGHSPARLGSADVLAALKSRGLDLTWVDPGQLAPAARYVNGGADAASRAWRLAQAAEAFRALAKLEALPWSRNRMADLLRTVARVPGRALAGLAEAEVGERCQEIARAVNLGPGLLRTKAGAFHLVLVVDEEGRVVRSSCRKRGVVSRVGGAIERTAGPLGTLVGRPLAAGESLGRASLVGLARFGAALLRSAARVGRARPARLRRRSWELDAEAANTSAFASYRKAGPLEVEARRALAVALATSDPAAIARAQKRLRQAEDGKAQALRNAAAGILGSRPRIASAPAVSAPVASASAARARAAAPVAAPPARPAASLATSAVLKSLARELRQTQAIIDRGRQAARDLYEIAKNPDLPEKLRVVAAASAFSVEEATEAFKRAIAEAPSEDATQAARLGFERRITGILEDHRQIYLALAALHARGARAAFRNLGSPPSGRT